MFHIWKFYHWELVLASFKCLKDCFWKAIKWTYFATLIESASCFQSTAVFFVISVQKAKKPQRAKEKPQLRVPKGAKMSKSSISKDDFKWVPSSGEKIRSKGYSNFAPNNGNFKLQSVTKMDYTSISTHNSPFKRKPRHNLKV